jgi:chromosome partitioning protein
MQVLSLVNQKGGCGKTTTAVNLAGALAARGESVLLVDLDPQAHATLALGQAPEQHEASVTEVLLDDAQASEAIVRCPGGIDLLPARLDLGEFEEISGRLLHPEQRLRVVLESVRGRYGWVVVDCPPRADGVLCANALFASTTAMLVVETGAFALQGALQALRVFEDAAERQNRVYRIRVVGTMFDRRTRFARELLIALHGRFTGAMYDTVIRSSVRLRESPAVGLPIQEHAPASRAAADFAALAEEVYLDKQVDLPASDGVRVGEAHRDVLGMSEPGQRLGSH